MKPSTSGRATGLTTSPKTRSGKSQYGYHLYFNQWHDTDLRAMLRRDRNHPSVVLYSIGNEIPNQLDRDGAKIARELIAICHEEDSTRPGHIRLRPVRRVLAQRLHGRPGPCRL